MGLNAALVDRARIIRQQTTGKKIEGTTIYEDVEQPWFRVRLTEAEAPEGSYDPRQKRVTRSAALLVARKDVAHNLVEIRASDRLEIRSRELGEGIWEVTAAPGPIRKKRRVIGWEAAVNQVDDAGS
jgi:hypothetical protein